MALNFDKLSKISSLVAGESTAPSIDGVTELALSAISPDPNQPRKEFAPEALADLAATIESVGVIQPIVVRVNPNGEGYLLVAGERRWRASKLAEKTTIPAIVRTTDLEPEKLAQIQLIENLQKEDLTPNETYRAITALIDGGMSQTDVAKGLGKSKAWVSAYASIAKMPESFQDALRDGRATDMTALVLLQKVWKLAPDLAEQLASSGAPITRFAVEQLSDRLASSATSGTVESKAISPKSAGSPAESELGEVADAGEAEAAEGTSGKSKRESSVFTATAKMAEDLCARIVTLIDAVREGKAYQLGTATNALLEAAEKAKGNLEDVRKEILWINDNTAH